MEPHTTTRLGKRRFTGSSRAWARSMRLIGAFKTLCALVACGEGGQFIGFDVASRDTRWVNLHRRHIPSQPGVASVSVNHPGWASDPESGIGGCPGANHGRGAFPGCQC